MKNQSLKKMRQIEKKVNTLQDDIEDLKTTTHAHINKPIISSLENGIAILKSAIDDYHPYGEN